MITTTTTANGCPVEIIGADKIHPKIGGIVDKMLQCNYYDDDRPIEYVGLKRIVFDDSGAPIGKCGWHVQGDITINILECFAAAKIVCDERLDTPIMATTWHVIIRVLWHELFHAWVRSATDLKFDDKKEEELAAEDFAYHQTASFAMAYDVEMPPAEEMGLLYELAIDWLKEKADEDPESLWVKEQYRMLEDGVAYVFSDVEEVSFRQYIRAFSAIKDQERWDEPALVTWEHVADVVARKAGTDMNEQTEVFAPDTPAEEEQQPERQVFFNQAGATPPPPPAQNEEVQVFFQGEAKAVPTPPAAAQAASVPPPPAAEPANAPAESEEDIESIDTPPEPEGFAYDSIPTDEEPALDEAYRQIHKDLEAGKVHHAYSQITQPSAGPAHNIPMDEMVASMQAIYLRLYQAIFDKCQPNGAGKFGNPGGVLEQVSIADIPHANELIHSCETVNQIGQPIRMNCNGQVKGTVFAKKGLAAFKLNLNVGGRIHKRTLVPQNPDTASKSAENARNGQKIAWIISGDYTDAQAEILRAQGKRASKFIAMIKDGRYITLK